MEDLVLDFFAAGVFLLPAYSRPSYIHIPLGYFWGKGCSFSEFSEEELCCHSVQLITVSAAAATGGAGDASATAVVVSVGSNVNISASVIVGADVVVSANINGKGRLPFHIVIVRIVIFRCGIHQSVGIKGSLIVLRVERENPVKETDDFCLVQLLLKFQKFFEFLFCQICF